MDEPTNPKRNRAEKKNKKQQIKESEIKNVDDGDNDSVFEDSQKQQVYLLLLLLLYHIYRLNFCMNAFYNILTYLLVSSDLNYINNINTIIISEIT